MKKILPFLALAVVASCGRKTEEKDASLVNLLEHLTYSVDTVLIDSGEELFNLSGMIHLEPQSTEFVYLFDEKPSKIQKIDLEKRALVSTFQFEKEGPDGIGTFLSNFQPLSDDRFLIASYESQGIFKADGTKELDLRLSNFSDLENDYQQEIQMPFAMQVSPDDKFAYSLNGDFFEGVWSFVRINLESKSLKIWEMPELLSSKNFTVTLKSNDGFDLRAEDIFLNILNEKVIIAAGNTSSIYSYDPVSDSLGFVSFPHELTAPEKIGTYPSEVTSKEEYNDVVSNIRSEITYETFIWDSSRELYFRLGNKRIRDSKKSEVFLYAYDSELNLIGEQMIEGLERPPSHYFFKDGKLWSYVNVEDELGFAVFTFNF